MSAQTALTRGEGVSRTPSLKTWHRLYAGLLAGFLVVLGALAYVSTNYRLFWDRTEPRCLPWQLYVQTHVDILQRGMPVAIIPPQQHVTQFHVPEQFRHMMFAKLVVGLPGDTIRVTSEMVYVNGKPVSKFFVDVGMPDAYLGLQPKLIDYITDHQRTPADFERTITLAEDEYFVMAGALTTIDSRHFGPVPAQSIRYALRPII